MSDETTQQDAQAAWEREAVEILRSKTDNARQYNARENKMVFDVRGPHLLVAQGEGVLGYIDRLTARAEAAEAREKALLDVLVGEPDVAMALGDLAEFWRSEADDADHQSIRAKCRENAERIRAKADALRAALGTDEGEAK